MSLLAPPPNHQTPCTGCSAYSLPQAPENSTRPGGGWACHDTPINGACVAECAPNYKPGNNGGPSVTCNEAGLYEQVVQGSCVPGMHSKGRGRLRES
jgi:hypothetical protein